MQSSQQDLAKQFAEHLLNRFGKDKVAARLAATSLKQQEEKQSQYQKERLLQFRDKPVEYAREILHLGPTPDQCLMLTALVEGPRRVMVPAGHNVGKSHGSAMAVNWWYDTRDPGIVITTAPTKRDVVDILWSEVRLQRVRAGLPCHFIGPSAPEMKTSEEHYAKGFTASKGESFSGRHRPNTLWVKDEAVGIDAIFWQTTDTMFDYRAGHAELNIYNPTDSSSAAYQQENAKDEQGRPKYQVIRLSALDHPNIVAALSGKTEVPIPGAVKLSQVNQWVADWCEPVGAGEAVSTDLEWPPGSGRYVRPGPIFQCRVQGIWPDSAYGVWSHSLWLIASKGIGTPRLTSVPEIGCDVARFGDDFTEIHIQDDGCSLLHEWHNGWDGSQTAGRLKQLARQMHAYCCEKNRDFTQTLRPEDIPIKVDCGGGDVGTSVMDQRGDFCFIPVATWDKAISPDYQNRRTELWFNVRELAKQRKVNFGRLSREAQERLRVQLMAPRCKVNAAGEYQIEKKEETKARLGFSPDAADAVNLSFFGAGVFRKIAPVSERPFQRFDERAGGVDRRGRNPFGRR